ncbi:NGFI-A-binding protein homolog isoform X3 [Macrobrachium rosenbergii]|uniref:NGFI-A-binding protein homolog isoform X3 n=1 Tax=Macrobrachium rosenbergii TaxID=79674 RepID=UPI0034D5FA3E
MLLVPPTTRAHATQPLVPPPAAERNAFSNSTTTTSPIPIKTEPAHYNITPPLTDNPRRPHMSGLSDTQYPPVSTANLSAPSTPAPPSTPTPAPPAATAASDRSGSAGSASGGSLPNNPSSVGGGVPPPPPPSGGSIAPPVSAPSSLGIVAPAMPVPGPSQGAQNPGSQQAPIPHPLLGYVPNGNKILSRNLNGTREYCSNNTRPNFPPVNQSGPNYPSLSQSDRRGDPLRRNQDYGLPMAVTSQPTNESELQLYRVLQRANLLNYYDTFISQGGDDVQQLCEAGEEEFLEIMALVGMASKPLHVRRLQKALQEWVSNPVHNSIPFRGVSPEAMFQIPLLPNLPPSVVAGFPSLTRGLLNTPTPTPASTRPSPPMTAPSIHPNHNSSPGITKDSMAAMNSNSMGGAGLRDGNVGMTPGVSIASSTASTPSIPISNPVGCPTSRDGPMGLGAGGMGVPMGGLPGGPMGAMGGGMPGGLGGSRGPSPHHTSPTHPGAIPPGSVGLQSAGVENNNHHQYQNQYPPPPGSPVQLTPVLLMSQVDRLAEAAYNLVNSLPPLEPKNQQQLANKRKMSKELEYIMNMSEDDPRRMEEIRKYAAIYGRFDCKRKPEKPLTLHEVSVNEAAAQICKYMPALLTRRDELFPLARQVVRDSGYQYSKGHSRSQTVVGRDDEPKTKRSRSDSGHDTSDLKNDLQWKKRQERLEAISEELRHMSEKAEEVRSTLSSGGGDIAALTSQMDALQSRHAQLTIEQNELLRAQRKAKSDRVSVCSEDRERGEDSDSQFSYSGASSPSQLYLQQLVQDTLVDEGLRVVKESLNQQKDAVTGSSRPQDTPTYPPRPQQDGTGKQNSTGGAAGVPVTTSASTPTSTPTTTAAAAGRLVSPPTTYSDIFSYPENKVRKVLSSSQGNIIAVTNPALSMSAALASPHMSDEERSISALYTLSQTVGAVAAARGNSIKQEPNSPGATKQE